MGLALVAGVSAAQTCMGGMAMGGGQAMEGMHAIPPPEKLAVPMKMAGLGNAHIAIKAGAEAQMWFDQGLNLMHDFWDYEGAKAFEQAIRVEPQCAMCWWGLAQIEGFRGGPDKVYGKKALAEAVRLKKHGSATDKLYIEAAEADAAGNSKAAVAVYRRLVKKEPQDAEARIFLAEAVGDGYDDKGEPKAGTKEKIAILEGVLKDYPNDSAANHYWIHALEPGNHPELALGSAQRLAGLAPASGHMVHMPGHIFYRVGDYRNAEVWFAKSTAVDEAYMRGQHVGPDDDWNYVHNMMYGIANLIEQGKLGEANALSDKLAGARGELSATLYVWSARDQMARLNNRLPVALRMGDWGAAETMLGQVKVVDGEKTKNLRFLAEELGAFAGGMKALDAGDVAGAEAASARLDAGLWRQEQSVKGAAKDEKKDAMKMDGMAMEPVMPDAVSGPLMAALGVAAKELRAGVLVGLGKLAEGKALYSEAALDEKGLGYHEPPIYIRPVGENEGLALLRAKDYAGAKAAYEMALKERPGSGFGLYGLARVAEAQGDAAGARAAYGEFLKAWGDADGAMPQVAHAKAVVEEAVVAGR